MDIKQKNIKDFSIDFNSKSKNILAKNAVTTVDLDNILLNRDVVQEFNNIFSKTLDLNDSIKVTNQKKSGRCWIYAYSTIIKYKMIEKYKLDNFEFSASYIFFYDKLEASNYFLHNIIKTKNEDINSRIVTCFLKEPISDGGNWSMFINIIKKYGMIPKESFNETYQTSNSNDINSFLNNKLRDYAYNIRNDNYIDCKNLNEYLEKCMNEIYTILVIAMGEPPKKIDWQYYTKKSNNKNKLYKIVQNITPLDFYKKYIPFNEDNLLLCADNPCKPYYTKIKIRYLNNMVGGLDTEFYNIPIEDIKLIVKKSIDNNKAIAFGCDVDKYFNESIGILDTNSIDYNKVFNTDIKLSKKNRLYYRTSDVNHAMVIKGYDNKTMKKIVKKSSKNKRKSKRGGYKSKKIDKYLVENSWGTNSGVDGNLIMTDNYFDQYLYEIIAEKRFIPKKILDIKKKKPIYLELWEPFGYLLNC